MTLQENIVNNRPLPIGPHRVLIRIREALGTRLRQLWDISFENGVWDIRAKYTPEAKYTSPSQVPLEDMFPWIQEPLRDNAWDDLHRRIIRGFKFDRDSLVNKRIILPHVFLTMIIVRQFKHVAKYYSKTGKVRISDSIHYAFATGNWGYGKVGVVSTLSSHNRLSDISELRKVKVAISQRSSAPQAARQLHPSHWGFYCCVETTEGNTCGLIRQLALSATVSDHITWNTMYTAILTAISENEQPLKSKTYDLYIDAIFAGVVSTSPQTIYNLSKRFRHITVWTHQNTLNVNCDGGRLVRPVLIHDKIVFVDSQMQNATEYRELFKCPSLGYLASLLPYPHHNQSPRSMYVLQMLKQGVMWNDSKRLWYPQKPICAPKTEGFFVQNAVVAILSSTGHNQEDSLIISSRAFDMGMFRHDQFKWYSNKPPSSPTYEPNSEYDKDGIPFIQSIISPDSLVFAHGSRNKSPTYLTIDKIELTPNTIRARTNQMRIPQQGDKFCSLHGQKGICGIVERPENLPFTRHGVTPDIIINPHAFPSRMTVGQILETLFGKSRTYAKIQSPVTFADTQMSDITQGLTRAGFSLSGKERMWDGPTGVPLTNPVFIGIASYLRLKHLVDDKIYARASTGPVDGFTKQPKSGRAQGGGLRLGEMEKDCLISHGAIAILQEKMFIHSDQDTIESCTQCGAFDRHCSCPDERTTLLPMCSATKLLIRELMALNIKLTLSTEETP